jgi:hypothetical protein
MVQFTVGQSEAALRSGRAFLMEAVNDLWNELTSTETVTLKQRVALRLAATHAIRLSAQIVENIYSASGATAAFEGNLIQRHFQDIHVITQHLQGRLSHYETLASTGWGCLSTRRAFRVPNIMKHVCVAAKTVDNEEGGAADIENISKTPDEVSGRFGGNPKGWHEFLPISASCS